MRKIAARTGLWLLFIGLTGCASEPMLLVVNQVELALPTGTDTDYAIGDKFHTRRELLAKRQPVSMWGSEFQLAGQDSDLTESDTQPSLWSGYRLPDVVVIRENTSLKIVKVEPVVANIPGAVPRIYAEILDGPLKGKRVSLAGISRERRLIDPEFLARNVELSSR